MTLSCGDHDTENTITAAAPVANVEIDPPHAVLQIGMTQQLSATTLDAGGAVLAGRVVTWLSADTAVATVDATGLVTARAAGEVVLTASSEGKNGASTIAVAFPTHASGPVARVDVSPVSATISRGQKVQLTAVARDRHGLVLPSTSVVWYSAGAAAVDANGLVTGVSAGKIPVYATIENVTGHSMIKVLQ